MIQFLEREITLTLSKLGLTELQIKVLLALQGYEYASIKEISKTGQIYRQEIYRVISELQAIGLIERKIGKPNQYKATPISQCLTTLLKREENSVSEIKKEITTLTAKLNGKQKLPARHDDFNFTLITGEERLREALGSWIADAQSLDCTLRFERHYHEEMHTFKTQQFKTNKNLKIRIVTCADKDMRLSAFIKKAEVRYVNFEIPAQIAIYDNKRAHIVISSSKGLHITDHGALTSNHPCFVEMLRNYFNLLWSNGVEDDTAENNNKAPITCSQKQVMTSF